MDTQNKIYDPNSKLPFLLSRTKIELFKECPRCFYLDQRLGIKRPRQLPFSLNIAVDHLLKKEFDIHRVKGNPHPLMSHYKIDAIPFDDGNLKEWRNNFHGIRYLHQPTNFLVYGALDDVWQNPAGELIVVDYKATSTSQKIDINDPERVYYDIYKREVEVYQWLLRQNGYQVSDQAYFIYCNAQKDRQAFDGKLEFEVEIIPYSGNDHWVENALFNIHQLLNEEKIPAPDPQCEYCQYQKQTLKISKL